MDIFGTKTNKNQLLKVKLLPKIIFRKNFTAREKKFFEALFTFRPISKQTADKLEQRFYSRFSYRCPHILKVHLNL